VEIISNPFASLFDTPRPVNKKSKWAEELDRYRKEERLDMNLDPLQWWKINKLKFPGLGMIFTSFLIARLYD
jgi:hypothetical protein